MFVGTSDLSGLVRGKAFPRSELDKRLRSGVGWTPTNAQITCFDSISKSPFGSFGDLVLVPEPETRFTVGGGEAVFDFLLGNILTLEGAPWTHCTRSLADRAIKGMYEACGAIPVAAFEHEFELKEPAPRLGDAYGLKGFRDAQVWAEDLLSALGQTSCEPDTFMKEFGPSKYELTNKPAKGLQAADDAVILRVLTGDVLLQHGRAPSFSPILTPDGTGNGVHLHMSFVDTKGDPLAHDANDHFGMSTLTRYFIGGILKHIDQILAILAPSEISYLRLTPHRWSAAYNNLGYRDREAAVRICPVSSLDERSVARQFNFEIRAIDAAASPYLVLAALIFAGTQGIKDKTLPPDPTEEDLSLLAPEALAAKGLRRLPESLSDSLTLLNRSKAVRSWFGDEFVNLYVAHKQGEILQLDGLDWAEKCDRYKDVY
ncbi:glutamine synthetase family protein [Ruegeria spongiae]|uniref:glutamine synthetase family protein n=1 Tax=Ruegeria spongiae TaxID=2942209 RepID=UPI0027E42520|nr:glutamine synthetase family protein [Ruegeria spongiae]